MAHKPLKVGFDLDGVILYNPARIARPVVAAFKSIFAKKKRHTFIVPKGKWERRIWSVLHLSSMFVAPGFQEIEKLTKEGKIEAYIVTARYSFLKEDFMKWQKKLNTHLHFKACHSNDKDEQPHLYKERMVKELDLDVFVEDNWDIVDHLSKKTKAKVLWIYNIFDRRINYENKFPSLKRALEEIKKMTNK